MNEFYQIILAMFLLIAFPSLMAMIGYTIAFLKSRYGEKEPPYDELEQ